MRYSQMLIPTVKEVPADAEIPSHQLMVRAGPDPQGRTFYARPAAEVAGLGPYPHRRHGRGRGPALCSRPARRARLTRSDGGALRVCSTTGGKTLSKRKPDGPPVFDGMVAARGRLFVSACDGTVRCLGAA